MINPASLNPVERAIYDTTLNKMNNTKATPSTGTIISVDNNSWTAKVEIIDPFSGDLISRDNVPLPVGANGVKAVNPSAGDKVAVNFASGDVYSPYIVNVFQSQASPNTLSSSFSSEIPLSFGVQ